MGCLCPSSGKVLSGIALKYQRTVGANLEAMMKQVGHVDDLLTLLAILALAAYSITVMLGRPNLNFKKIYAGIVLVKNGCTFLKLGGGLEAFFTGKACFELETQTKKNGQVAKDKNQKPIEEKVWKAMKPVPAIGGGLLTVGRILVCTLALQTLAPNIFALGKHSVWITATLVSAFASATILFLADAAYTYHHKKYAPANNKEEKAKNRKEVAQERKNLVASCLDAAALPHELGVLAESAPAPALLAAALVAGVAAGFHVYRNCSKPHPDYPKAAPAA